MQDLPWGSSTLCLALAFDLSEVADHTSLRSRDHQATCAAACAASKLISAASVAARAVTTAGEAGLREARELPFDEWHDPAAHSVRLEFLWSTASPQVSLRVLCELPCCDGVTALRVALHTLEALEGQSLCAAAPFKRNPPFSFTLRHAARSLPNLLGACGRAAGAWLRQLSCGGSAMVKDRPIRTSSGLLAYYDAPAPPPGLFRIYATATSDAYKSYISALQLWADLSGTKAFYTLLNFAPGVVASIVPRAEDLMRIERRYAGALVPATQPPNGIKWLVLNHLHISVIFVNNYGRHSQPAFCGTGSAWRLRFRGRAASPSTECSWRGRAARAQTWTPARTSSSRRWALRWRNTSRWSGRWSSAGDDSFNAGRVHVDVANSIYSVRLRVLSLALWRLLSLTVPFFTIPAPPSRCACTAGTRWRAAATRARCERVR